MENPGTLTKSLICFSSSCPLTRDLAPILEHRADFSVSQAVGLLGREISSSQGLYLNTGQHKHTKTRTHIKHPCPERNSNPQSRPPSDRRLFMPQTARLPRTASHQYTYQNTVSSQEFLIQFSCPMQIISKLYQEVLGRHYRPRRNVVGSGTMLQAGRSQLRFPIRSLNFSVD
jgi:hypothetical protein